MAQTYELGLRIAGDSKEAVKAIDDLDKELSGLKLVSSEASKGLDEVKKKTDEVATSSDRAAGSNKTLAQSFSQLGRSISSIGRSITAITAPLSILSAMSLKNVFDLGGLEGASGSFKEFNTSVSTLVRNFKSLTVEIGSVLIPVIQPLINFITSITTEFRKLDDETKKIIGTIGLVSAGVGPLLIVFGSLGSLLGTVMPLLASLGTAFTAIAAAITPLGVVLASLAASVIGTIGVFMKLREAGESTSDALMDSFMLFVTGFNKYVVGSFAKGATALLSMLSDLTSIFSEKIAASIDKATLSVANFADGLDAEFSQQRQKIDSTLEKVGSSAGDAFTFGMSSKLEGMTDKIKKMFETQNVDGMNLGLADALEKENKKIDAPLSEIQKKAQIIQDQITNHMTDAFMSISAGTERAEEAFKKMAMAIIRDLQRMAIQAAITNALFPGGGLAGAVQGFASGGLVTGPGTGTSDSIPARLSNGEFVVRASAVKSVGVGFLNAINALGSRSFKRKELGGFADGGTVSGGSTQGVSVNVVNNGTPKNVSEASYDPESMVVSVVLDDLNRNGSITRAIGGTFGINRGDFR